MDALLLPVATGDHDVDCAFALLTVDRPMLRTILQRMDDAAAYQVVDPRTAQLVFWDETPVYLGWDDALDAILTGRTTDDGRPLPWHRDGRAGEWALLSTEAPDDVSPVRVECGQMVVTPDEVWWTAILKHTGIRLTTAGLAQADLARLVGAHERVQGRMSTPL